MNYANLAQKTNFIAGSNKFENIPFFLTNVNIPGISLSHQQVGGRQSVAMYASANTVAYNPLNIEILIDEDFLIYQEIMKLIKSNVGIKSGTFGDFYFDFWIELNNNKGNKVMKLEFSNCRIESIGDLELSTQDDTTEWTLSLGMVYDFYEIEDVKRYELITTSAGVINVTPRQLHFEDNFSELNETYWRTWGFPTPIIINEIDALNGYALDTNGDTVSESGVVSNGVQIDVLKPFKFSFRVKQPNGLTSNSHYYIKFGITEGIGIQSTTNGRTGASVMEVTVDGGSRNGTSIQNYNYSIRGIDDIVIGDYSNDGQYHEFTFDYTPETTTANYAIYRDEVLMHSFTDTISTHDFFYLFVQGQSDQGQHFVDYIKGDFGEII